MTATVGTAITPITFRTTRADATATLSGTLPAGLDFDSANKQITGTPTTAKTATDYTITFAGDGTNFTGAVIDDITITVNAATVTGLTVATPLTVTGGSDITPITFTTTPAGATGTLSGTLPAGLSFDSANKQIKGTPTAVSAATDYTITFTGNGIFTGSATATVNIKVNLGIGVSYKGGIVFYLDGKGGGLIAATSDHSSEVDWGGAYEGTEITGGADGSGSGTGKQNTADIVAQYKDNGGTAYAAKVADDYSVTVDGVTYSDWFLPSKDELKQMLENKDKIGGFSTVALTTGYWSSSEQASRYAWKETDTRQVSSQKYYPNWVRPVREF